MEGSIMLTRRAFTSFIASLPLLGFAGLATAKKECLGFYDPETFIPERKIVSVCIESGFELEQVFEGGSLEVFENIEPIEYTITLEYDNGDTDGYVTKEVSYSNKCKWIKWQSVPPCAIKTPSPVSESCSDSTRRLYYAISEIKIKDNDIYMSINCEIKEISNTVCIFKNCKMMAKPGQMVMSEGCYKELKEWTDEA
jgi:hypothetical protein